MNKRGRSVIACCIIALVFTGCSADNEINGMINEIIVNATVNYINDVGCEQRFEDIQKENTLQYMGNGIFKSVNNNTLKNKIVDISCLELINKEYTNVYNVGETLIAGINEDGLTELMTHNGQLVETGINKAYASKDNQHIYIVKDQALTKYERVLEKIKSESGVISDKIALKYIWSTPECDRLECDSLSRVTDNQGIIVGKLGNKARVLDSTNGRMLVMLNGFFKVAKTGTVYVRENDIIKIKREDAEKHITVPFEEYTIDTTVGDNAVIRDKNGELHIITDEENIIKLNNIVKITNNLIITKDLEDEKYTVLDSNANKIDTVGSVGEIFDGEDYSIIDDTIKKVVNLYVNNAKLLSIPYGNKKPVYTGNVLIVGSTLFKVGQDGMYKRTLGIDDAKGLIEGNYLEIIDGDTRVEVNTNYLSESIIVDKDTGIEILDIHGSKIIIAKTSDKKKVFEVVKFKAVDDQNNLDIH